MKNFEQADQGSESRFRAQLEGMGADPKEIEDMIARINAESSAPTFEPKLDQSEKAAKILEDQWQSEADRELLFQRAIEKYARGIEEEEKAA